MDDLAVLIESQIPALRRYATALLRQREAADDYLVQDTLERAIHAWPQRREGDLRAWLFAILRNRSLEGIRRRGIEVGPGALTEIAEAGVDPEAAVGARDVFDEIAVLPEEQRSVLLLVAVEDMSYAEVAAVLAVPIGMMMSRLSRARGRMRAFLNQAPTIVTGHPRRVK
ncbi:RNA polymerase sigma factor [Methylorubrum salsuginis]|uniref:RNA polymerase sigma-70 factor, ECF subfamily n=1 Tax=Methylorubrum salsuginis TaxID=414703 RepID=A0A1I4MDT3_9HYPH|nr:sigma-70 family RNA polymerase sigma factor [Methylorubrum salsuginis]SFM01408.1 RNA polymerase sigma-70 factor, ECF subfamily [Methylorubrum salsuginis]